MTAWTKRISDSQAKVYVKYPTIGQKVRISHQTGGNGEYKTVCVKTTTRETMDGLRIVEGVGIYIVRTINLVDINRIRVTVGDERMVQVRYNGQSTHECDDLFQLGCFQCLRWFFKGGIDSCEVWDFTRSCFFIEPLGVSLFADFQWRINKHKGES